MPARPRMQPRGTHPEGDLWFDVVQQLLQSEAVVAVARQLALQSQLLGREGDLWRLRVESRLAESGWHA